MASSFASITPLPSLKAANYRPHKHLLKRLKKNPTKLKGLTVFMSNDKNNIQNNGQHHHHHPQIFLPDGFPMKYVKGTNREEAEFLKNEIFSSESYLRNGVTINSNDVVFDVGANIGLFSIYAAKKCNRGELYCFEPIPKIYDVLNLNLNNFENVYSSSFSGKFCCMNIGISNGETSTGNFIFYERASGWSTMSPLENDVKNDMDVFFANYFSSNFLPSSFLVQIGQFLTNFKILKPFSKIFVQFLLSKKQNIACKLFSISQILSMYKIERIDLLKIDVERSEMKVLAGIEGQDWKKIKQIVVEVHDINNNLKQIVDMLTQKGFRVTVEQTQELKGSALYNLYAIKE